MEDSGATVEHEDGIQALVASAADPEQFEQLFLEIFAGGELTAMELTSDEEQYLGAMRTAIARLGAVVDNTFAGVEAQADQVPADDLATQLIDDVFDGMGALHEELSGIEGPDRLRAEHAALVEAIVTFRDVEDAYLDAILADAPPEPLGADGFFDFFFRATEAAGLVSPFEVFEIACSNLDLAAYGLGATKKTCLIE
jgi:hypothetical protein